MLQWRHTVPGLDYAQGQVTTDGDHQPAAVHVLRMDLALVQLQVVMAAETGARLAQAPAFRSHAKALAACNGGYFDPDFVPLGLLVSQGGELSPLRKVDHGIFAVSARRARVEHAKKWQRPAELEFAIECGPRLLVGGVAPHFRQDDTARRVALGVDSAQRTVLAVSEGAATLRDFAAWLALDAASGGPAVTDAINLDGGPSAMLDLRAGGVQAEVRTAVQVPVGLVVVAR